MVKMEQPSQPEKKPSIFDEEDFKAFIKMRDIEPEDYEMIEQFAQYPKIMFHDYHNFFGFARERSAKELQHDLDNMEESKAERREFTELLLAFVQKYDWTAGMNLIAIFERRQTKK